MSRGKMPEVFRQRPFHLQSQLEFVPRKKTSPSTSKISGKKRSEKTTPKPTYLLPSVNDVFC